MKAWKHVLEDENLGIVLAPSRRSAERIWKRVYPQSVLADDVYFMEEATEFSEMSEPEGSVKDWNDQLCRRDLMEHNISMNERVCPLSSFEGASCRACLSWSICPYNEFTDFLIDKAGKLVINNIGDSITSADFERRQLHEIEELKKLRAYENDSILTS